MSQSEFWEIAPHSIKKHIDEAFPRRGWTACIESRYRGASVDVVWVFGKNQSMQSWVVQNGGWINLQGNTQFKALTIALQPDLRVLKMEPNEEDVIVFCLEVIKLMRGGGGRLLTQSFSNTITKIHRIEQENEILPEDKTHLVIRPLCHSIKLVEGLKGKMIIFQYLGGSGSVEEWCVDIDKKSVKSVHVRTILKDASLMRWLPTG